MPCIKKIALKDGTIIIPPPMPNNPAATPTNAPNKQYNKIDSRPNISLPLTLKAVFNTFVFN
jgi:hypothetical protein